MQAASDAARAAASQRLDHWLAPGIVVKVRFLGVAAMGMGGRPSCPGVPATVGERVNCLQAFSCRRGCDTSPAA